MTGTFVDMGSEVAGRGVASLASESLLRCGAGEHIVQDPIFAFDFWRVVEVSVYI